MEAKFVTSCATFEQTKAIAPDLPQFAFVGRSNAGKSSLLNMLTNQKRLAVTSQTPGRTRLINFFYIKYQNPLKTPNKYSKNEKTPNIVNIEKVNIYLVDLPGYGFASASKSAKDGWGQHITDYLTKTPALRRVFVLMDIRHRPSALDMQMLHFLQTHGTPFTIIATKADKLSRAAANTHLCTLANHLGVGKFNIIVTSAKMRLGKEDILSIISCSESHSPAHKLS